MTAMTETEKFLIELVDRAGEDSIRVEGKCQHCGELVVLDLDYVGGRVEVVGNGGMKYYVHAGKPCFLCSTCHGLGRKLGSPTEVYSRVVGYLSPVNRWNKGKREEFDMRKEFDVRTLPDIPTV